MPPFEIPDDVEILCNVICDQGPELPENGELVADSCFSSQGLVSFTYVAEYPARNALVDSSHVARICKNPPRFLKDAPVRYT